MALPVRVIRGALLDPFEAAHREFDSLLGRMFGRETDGGVGYGLYPVDVREDADHIYVEAELPGFKKEDVDLTLENQTLSISAERKEEKTSGDYLVRERRYGRLLRSFTLPPTVDDRKVEARMADGILTVTLNKREETKPKKIALS
jgi:HSP20 family protein